MEESGGDGGFFSGGEEVSDAAGVLWGRVKGWVGRRRSVVWCVLWDAGAGTCLHVCVYGSMEVAALPGAGAPMHLNQWYQREGCILEECGGGGGFCPGEEEVALMLRWFVRGCVG